MAEDSGGKSAESPDEATATTATKGPPLTIRGQYLKDLSFENPVGAQAMATGEGPTVSLAVDVNANQLADNNYEVVLTLRADAKRGEQAVFVTEVHYAGVFAVGEVADEHVQLLLLIEAPRLLFPFARAILANSVRDGGFPPLSIQPIDFVALYRQRVAQLRQQQQQPDKPVEGQAQAASGNGQAQPDGGSASA